MSGTRPSRNDGQDTSLHDGVPHESQRHPANVQQAYPPSLPVQHQPQYIHTEQTDMMRMSSLQNALPSVQHAAYGSGQRYPAMNLVDPYQQHSQGQQSTYHGYPQSPIQAGGMQYQPYMDAGHGLQYSPMQAQFPAQSMYSGAQMQQYGVYPPGFGPPSPAQQRGIPGLSPGYPGQEYGHVGTMPVQGSTLGAGRLPYASRPKPPSTSPTVPAAPRGPPRKPKQSGHALWVGNLPPGTHVSDLKDHFAREATKDLESVFLISKSNCAFVNYRSEEACAAAMARFHDSRFQGVRLVTRLRKNPGTPSSPGDGASGPIPSGPAAQSQTTPTQTQTAVEAIAQNRESSQKAAESSPSTEATVGDKYFVVKSLTIEDLELSARNGIWATQGHNEEALNKAYETVDNVYLIFSANKSGEYFGYARMESSIDDETAKNLEWKRDEGSSRAETRAADPELPRAIPTVATEWAPKGRIIDDSARGTIFWEAEPDDMEQKPRESLADGVDGVDGEDEESADESEEEEEEDADKGKPAAQTTADSAEGTSHQPFGRPFRVRWVSTSRLPFYRTRGLRNAWNANREVKIARDGTELETSVGRRLVAMFQRPAGPQVQMQQQMQQSQQYIGQMGGLMGYMPPYSGRY